MPEDRYHSDRDPDERQLPRRRVRTRQDASGAGAGGSGAPGFPTVAALKALNERIHEDAGTPERYKLDQPSPLRSCLEHAENAYSPGGGPENVVRVAALIAHGITQAQAFRDGNRRTAYIATQTFLEANDLAHVSSLDKDDDMLARRLNQIVAAQTRLKTPVTAADIETIFLRRLRRTTMRP
jgi:prophage maintenance system killer protein